MTPSKFAMFVRAFAACFVAAGLVYPASADEVKEFEVDPSEAVRVPVTEFVPADLIKGRHHVMNSHAIIQRNVALFSLDTTWGRTEVVGTTNLLARINEFGAIETLDNMKRSEVYEEALKKSAKGPVETAKGLAKEPGKTLKNAAKGLGGFLADVGYSVVSRDPSQENVAKTALGFAAAKRQFAHQLGVNPYSSFEPLQDALSEVAWTAVGGGLTVTAAFRAVPNKPASTALSASKTANTGRLLVRDNSPRKLARVNEDMLLQMGIDESLAEQLLDNFNYDPEAETRLIVALSSLDGTAGRGDFVARATLASTRAQAHLMRDWAELIAAYHDKVSPVKRIIVLMSTPFVIDRRGKVNGVFPTDYATWTPLIEGRIDRLADELRSRGMQPDTIWATGKIDPRVVQALRDRGWREVKEHAETTLRAP